MNLFFTPDKTLLISLAWSEEHRTFLAVPPKEGEPVFELATPTERQAHDKYHALMAIPTAGGYERTADLMWGTKDEKGAVVTKGLVRSCKGMPAGASPTPPLTIALARIVREECGLSPRLVDPSAPRLDAEGNSDSPSGSGSDSTPSPAGSANPPSADRT